MPGMSCEKREESRFSGTSDIEEWVKQGGVAEGGGGEGGVAEGGGGEAWLWRPSSNMWTELLDIGDCRINHRRGVQVSSNGVG